MQRTEDDEWAAHCEQGGSQGALEAATQKAAIAAAAAGGHLQEIHDACKAKCAGQVSLHCVIVLCGPCPVLVTAVLALAGLPRSGLTFL